MKDTYIVGLLILTFMSCSPSSESKSWYIYVCRSDSSTIDYLGELNRPLPVYIIDSTTKILHKDKTVIDTIFTITYICNREAVLNNKRLYDKVIDLYRPKYNFIKECMKNGHNTSKTYHSSNYIVISSVSIKSKVFHLLVENANYPGVKMNIDTILYISGSNCHICNHVGMGKFHSITGYQKIAYVLYYSHFRLK